MIISAQKIEKDLILSINNKETITRERINLAESIRFKDEPDKIILTDQFGFIKNDELKNSIKSSFNKKNRKKSFIRMRSKSARILLQVNARIEKWNFMLNNFDKKKRYIKITNT